MESTRPSSSHEHFAHIPPKEANKENKSSFLQKTHREIRMDELRKRIGPTAPLTKNRLFSKRKTPLKIHVPKLEGRTAPTSSMANDTFLPMIPFLLAQAFPPHILANLLPQEQNAPLSQEHDPFDDYFDKKIEVLEKLTKR